tara:strand:- start:108 stop:1535 length:1428 start_codon:yes stop_codon:yes gene_type:complete
MSLLIPGTNSIKDTGYDVANSCRFNDGSSDTLSRTPSSTGSNKTWTYSAWVKRTAVGTWGGILDAGDGSSWTDIYFFSSDKLTLRHYTSGSTPIYFETNRLFRDPSAWVHVVVAVDTTQSTESNRVKIYVNGSQVTSFSSATYPSLNYDTYVNSTNEHRIGISKGTGGGSNYFDGYLAEVCLIDGTALDPTSFGEFDSDSPNIWKPKDVSGLTFGTNGFYLDFQDSSALGNDVSGNNNDYTANNLTSLDQSTDTCTNNFAILNPLYHYIGGATLSEGNLKFTTSGNSSVGRGMSTIRPESGKWYVECKIIDVTRFAFGLMNGNETNDSQGGNDTNSVIFGYDGGFFMAGSFSGYLSAPSNNDIVQLALDLDNDLFWIGVNDTWGNSATRTQIENGTASNDATTFISSKVPINTGAIGIFVEDNSSTGNNVSEINFGSPSYSISSGNSDGNGYGNFEYAVPSGYYALNTKNLAEFG